MGKGEREENMCVYRAQFKPLVDLSLTKQTNHIPHEYEKKYTFVYLVKINRTLCLRSGTILFYS